MTIFDLSLPRAGRHSIVLALALTGLSGPAVASVQISQVYGGGGNSGAPLIADFVELRNTGAAAVSLAGWSVQYASATGSSWAGTPLTGSIPIGGYYLIKLANGANLSAPPLPLPDATGTTLLGAAAGKLALVSSTTALAGACPITDARVVDFVGFGVTASCFEGSGPTPAPSNTAAVLRADGGCIDSNNNASDFAPGVPQPRNSASAAQACGNGTGSQPMAAAIFTIQGSAAKSTMAGKLVLTQGVVTRLLNNGFFIQDLTSDGDSATSDGILVFTGSSAYPAVAVGNLVAVTGTVTEFNTGAASNADTLAHTVTELSGVTSVALVGSGYTIAPTAVTLPEAVNDDLERYEGMLVTIGGPFTIAQNFFQGRYGQLTLAAGGRLETPTNRHRPGSQALALADENARRRIILDDGSSQQNPNPTPYLGAGALPRGGDVLPGALTGVIDYGLATNSNTGAGDYKLHPTVAPVFATANARMSAPAAVGGNVKVASFNVLNYFTTFTDGTTASGQTGQGCSLGSDVRASNCRGASNLVEFDRQRAKIVDAVVALDADIVGLMEIQNNGSLAVQNLVDALNARLGAGTYATIALPAKGTGTDAIRVAMIYKPARVGLLGAPRSDSAAINNRPPLSQTFQLANGERFSVIVNHLKSKGSCPLPGDADYAGNQDSGDGQGCWNAQRVQQAQQLRTFVAQVQSAAGSNDALLIGDLNAYAQEDPIYDLVSSGYVDQLARFEAASYSYVFDGAVGRLDHAIATSSLSSRVSRAMHWHINADEIALADYNLEFKSPALCNGTTSCPPDPYTVTPYRSSDHDPVIVGLGIYKTIAAPVGSNSVTGTAGDDVILSGAGRRSLSGGGGNDQFVFVAGFAGGATITDFGPGDTVSLRALLQSLGIPSADPIGQGYVTCRGSGADALIQVDPDASGPALARPMVLIKSSGCAVLSAPNFVF